MDGEQVQPEMMEHSAAKASFGRKVGGATPMHRSHSSKGIGMMRGNRKSHKPMNRMGTTAKYKR